MGALRDLSLSMLTDSSVNQGMRRTKKETNFPLQHSPGAFRNKLLLVHIPQNRRCSVLLLVVKLYFRLLALHELIVTHGPVSLK